MEVPLGVSLGEMIYDIGGGMAGPRPLKAVQAGGPSAGCLPASALDLRIDAADRPGETVSMGTGGIIVLDDTACMVDMARYLLDFFVEESCGKCVPCREGTKHMLRILTRICRGQGTGEDLGLLERLARHVKLASLCGLGAVAPDPVLAALQYFREEFETHIRDQKCPAGVCRDMGCPAEQRTRGKEACNCVKAVEHDCIGSPDDYHRRPHDGGRPGHDDPRRRAADGHNHPHAVQLSRPAGLCRLPRVPGGTGNAARAALRGLVQPSGRSGANRPYRYGTGAPIAANGFGVDAGRGARVAGTGRVRRQAGRASRPPSSRRPDGQCVLCGLCVRVCGQLMGRGAVNMVGRGAAREVAPAFGEQTDQCQACGACEFVCPTGARQGLDAITARQPQPHLTAHDQYLEARPNIDLAHPQASPRVPVIDRETCVHFKTGACGLCSQVCQAKAIDYEQQEETLSLEVGSVVLTPGFEAFDATRRGEFGYSFAPNVVSNVQFERLLSASGPTLRTHPSPQRPQAAQTAGLDPVRRLARYGLRQRILLLGLLHGRHEGGDPGPATRARPRSDHLLPRSAGVRQGFRSLCRAGRETMGRALHPVVHLADLRNARHAEPAAGLRQPGNETGRSRVRHGRAFAGPGAQRQLREQAERMGVVLNRWGFAQTDELCPLDTSRPGIFVGGAFQEPKDIPDTVMQASAAAARAMALLAPARGSRVREELSARTRHQRRAAAGRRVRVPLRQQHRLGGRRGAGGARDPPSCPSSSMPKTTSTPAPATARTASRPRSPSIGSIAW